MTAHRILHVLPHAGGGGQTYIEQLETMRAFRFERFELTKRRQPIELGSGLARLARTVRKHDLIHIHGDSAALASWPVTGGRPTVITLHGSHLLRRRSGVRGGVVRAGIRRAFARADTVIAVSESEFEYARRIALGTADRVELIHNGVPNAEPPSEADRRATREQLGLDEAWFVAVFVGELSERKQPIQFAQAVEHARSSNPKIVGLIAGDGHMRPRLDQMQGDGLRLLGSCHDVKQLLASSDAFVLPSLWEGLSYALLEAMALGKPTLVSDGPGNPDAVGDAGLIFPVGDVSKMSASLSRLAADAALRRSLGQAAVERARQHFSLSDMTESTARVYEQALNRGTGH
jgi:glycosyltransferase involved in cell wall biosynthesis